MDSEEGEREVMTLVEVALEWGDVPGRILSRLVCDSLGRLWFFGGMVNRRTHTDILCCIDPDSQQITVIEKVDGDVWPPARNAHACDCIDDEIIVTGGKGFRGTGECSQVFVYNIASGKWRAGPSYEDCGYGQGSAVLGDEMYFYGGSTSATCLRAYNPRTNEVRVVSNDGPEKRYYCSMAAVGSKIYLFGSFTGTVDPKVFDVYTNSWSDVEVMWEVSSRPPNSRFGLAAADPFIYLLGDDKTLYRFDTRTNVMTGEKVITPVRSRRCADMVRVGSYMYEFGGDGDMYLERFRHKGMISSIFQWDPSTHQLANDEFKFGVRLLMTLHQYGTLQALPREVMYLIIRELYASRARFYLRESSTCSTMRLVLKEEGSSKGMFMSYIPGDRPYASLMEGIAARMKVKASQIKSVYTVIEPVTGMSTKVQLNANENWKLLQNNDVVVVVLQT